MIAIGEKVKSHRSEKGRGDCGKRIAQDDISEIFFLQNVKIAIDESGKFKFLLFGFLTVNFVFSGVTKARGNHNKPEKQKHARIYKGNFDVTALAV